METLKFTAKIPNKTVNLTVSNVIELWNKIPAHYILLHISHTKYIFYANSETYLTLVVQSQYGHNRKVWLFGISTFSPSNTVHTKVLLALMMYYSTLQQQEHTADSFVCSGKEWEILRVRATKAQGVAHIISQGCKFNSNTLEFFCSVQYPAVN